MIEVKNLVRRYGDFAAVDDVSFGIEAGEVVGLLGHNGAGKTTIMKMLTGYLEPSAGEIRVKGLDVQDNRVEVQQQMGYLPENLPLYPELTVCEYLSYAAELRGLDERRSVPEAIAATQLEAKALDPIHTLSRGFKQRVGVAQAILHKPAFLILDEPSNGLDPNQIQHMRDLITNLSAEATVMLSTHIMQEVNAVCDRALILRGGKLVVDEKLDNLRRADAVLLRTAAGVDVAAALAGQSDIVAINPLGEGQWRIELGGTVSVDDARLASLAASLVGADVPIYAMSPQTQDLETLFREVSEADLGEVTDAA